MNYKNLLMSELAAGTIAIATSFVTTVPIFNAIGIFVVWWVAAYLIYELLDKAVWSRSHA